MKHSKTALIVASAFFLLTFATGAFAQSDKDWWKMSDQRKDQPAPSPQMRTGPTRGQLAIEDKLPAAPEDKTSGTSRRLTRSDTLITRDSTVFVDEMGGFEHYLMAAMRKKSVGLIVVADPMQADYIIFGNSDSKRAGWAKMFFLGSGKSGEMASITMVNRRTKVVMFSDSSHRYNANRGKRSTAEKLAKYLGKQIKQDEKKLKN
ncbi:MAG TPA: hypothetical protein DCK93_10790 [Blastocatellia bacterium]|jgi:hypothetical protein|nr:hypothetical protein [Blastocatellia bacterium]HAF23374.1 hypothetical protein [Blastocatellia bacterium]